MLSGEMKVLRAGPAPLTLASLALMDGVIVFFAAASASQVNAYAQLLDGGAAVSRGEAQFFLRPYDGWSNELDQVEREEVASRLGGSPASAFTLEARHGAPARLALEWLAECASQLGPFVVDDDFGRLLSVRDVERLVHASGKTDIYTPRAEG